MAIDRAAVVFFLEKGICQKRQVRQSSFVSVWMKIPLLLTCSTLLYDSVVAAAVGLAGTGAWDERKQRPFT